MDKIKSRKILDDTIIDSIWYLINSYHFTMDMGGFQANPKKITRILSGNLFEYFFVNTLRENGFQVKHDKEDPFITDDGTDIVVDNRINIHAKASTISSMLGQVRNGNKLIAEMKRSDGYIMIGYIPSNSVTLIAELILNPYVSKYGFVVSKEGFVSKEEIVNRVIDLCIDLNQFDPNVRIDGFISIKDYFNTANFVKGGDIIPETKFIQSFSEGSYFLSSEGKKILKPFKEIYN